MSEDARKPAEGVAEILKMIQSMQQDIQGLKWRLKPQPPRPNQGLPPLPPASAMGAWGPMMTAWMLSWLYANPRAEPEMLRSMAHFAGSREDFWQYSRDILAMMACSAGGADEWWWCEPISAEDKQRVKDTLKAANIADKVIDCVFHAIKLLEYMQRCRERDPRRLAMMAYSGYATDEWCEPPISDDDKKKIKKALEDANIGAKVIDYVFHAIRFLEHLQGCRERYPRWPC